MNKNKIAFQSAITKGVLALAAGFILTLGIQGGTVAHAEGDMGSMANMAGMQESHDTTEKFSFGEPGKSDQVTRTVRVTLNTMSFSPKSLHVKVGETIRFVVTNKSQLDHEFALGDVKSQIEHRAEMVKMGTMANDDDPNAITVNAGQTRELVWKFTNAGRLEFDCNVPGHYEAGMKGIIVVKA